MPVFQKILEYIEPAAALYEKSSNNDRVLMLVAGIIVNNRSV